MDTEDENRPLTWLQEKSVNADINNNIFTGQIFIFSILCEEKGFITRRSVTFLIDDVLRRRKDYLWREIYPHTLLTGLLSWNSRGRSCICGCFLI